MKSGKRKNGVLSKIYIALIMIFMYAPIAVLIFFSFNCVYWSNIRTLWYF